MAMLSGLTRLGCVAGLAALTGCVSLPNDGPSYSNIQAEAADKSQPAKYVLIPVDQRVVDTMAPKGVPAPASGGVLNISSVPVVGSADGSGGVPGFDPTRTTAIQKIVVGDVVGVSLYTSGLFVGGATAGESQAGQSETKLPPQLVDSSGQITVPYVAEPITVVGHTATEVEKMILGDLKDKASNSTVIVTIEERRGSDLVTITGDVRNPTRIPVPMSGLRIIDAVTAAGGSTGRDYETKVIILGAANIREYNYSDVVALPSENVPLQVGDIVMVKTKPWSFMSLGATGQSLHPFPSQELSAEEALASVSALNDDKANPEAVFIYRFESPQMLKALGAGPGPVTPDGVPVIYQLNLRKPDGFFMARQFAMRDKDIIFVGNAGSIGIIKAFSVVGALTSPAISGASTAAGAATIIH